MSERTSPDFNPVSEVKNFLTKSDFDIEIIHTDETIFTVADASIAVGAPEKEILKSILLRVNSGAYYGLALMSGVNKVDTKKIKKLLHEKHLSFASPEECYEWSGFRPGGVPPIGYPTQPVTLLDEDLFLYDTVWAAAGTDHDFFPIAPDDLLKITNGEKADIKKDEVQA
ncbi:MAG: YbaK/EbsC family protein [Synergistaceae bacterium]